MANEKQHRPCDTSLVPKLSKSPLGSALGRRVRKREQNLESDYSPKIDLSFKPEVTV